MEIQTMEIESDIAVWVWDHGCWLAATVIEPGELHAMVRFNGGVAVAVPLSDLKPRDVQCRGADRPPVRVKLASEIRQYASAYRELVER
jgi:hypothetical protein